MRARIWGCRGSMASPALSTVKYGGNTSCVEVRLANDTMIVLDAGTGLHALGLQLQAEPPRTIHLLLTHLHMDHLEGLAFFGPLWNQDFEIHLWGPPSPTHSLFERIERYMSPPLFPIELSYIPSRCSFHDVPDEEWNIGSAKILAERIQHPGETLGFRIEEDGRSLAYMPDHEPALVVNLETASPEWVPGYEIARGADVLLHDSTYTEDEYLVRKTWGHSSVADAVRYAQVSRAAQLVLFHHGPYRSDEELEAMLARARELWGPEGAPLLGREGMEIRLDSTSN